MEIQKCNYDNTKHLEQHLDFIVNNAHGRLTRKQFEMYSK